MARSILLRTVLIVALSLPSTFAIKCFVCNSATQPNCAKSPPSSEYLMECSKDTLDVLNDYHRQRKMDDVAAEVVEKKGEDGVKVHDHDHYDHDHLSEDEHAHTEEHSKSSGFDSNDKDLALNRTRRDAEETANKTDAKPLPNPPMPAAAIPVKLPREATFCRSTSYHIPRQENGINSTLPKSVRIIRSCGWISEERSDGEPMKNGCKWIGTDGVQMDQCVCTGDACNPADTLTSLKIQTLLLSSIMSIGYMYLL